MSRAEKRQAASLGHLVEKRMSYFGEDKSRVDFTLEVERSLDRYESRRRPEFYAIVMHSCSGKTQLCKKYGFIDIDELTTKGEHSTLNSMRFEALRTGDWEEHNEAWLSWMNPTLDLLFSVTPRVAEGEVEEPRVPMIVMVQSEITALAIGALPLVGLFPDEQLFHRTMETLVASGDSARADFARLDRVSFLSHSQIMMRTKRSFSSFEEAEQLVLKTLVINHLPCPAPFKATRLVYPPHYTRSCPEWVLRGDKSQLNVDILCELYRTGGIPRCAMTYFLRRAEIPASFGFGTHDREWAFLISNMRASITDAKDFDIDGDMGKIFPYIYEKNLTRANITVARLVKGANIFSDPEVYEIASHHVGKPNNFVSTILCYWIGIGSHSRYRDFIKQILGVSYYLWGDIMKQFHNCVRVSDDILGFKIDEKERHRLMYLNDMLGKEVEETDWVKEVVDRTWDYELPDHRSYDPNLQMWTGEQYQKDFIVALNSTYSQLGKGHDSHIADFSEFYERRWEWLTKGSTVLNNLSPDDRKYTLNLVSEVGEVVESVGGRHNKKSLFEVMHAVAESKPDFEMFNATKIVTKLDENGHKRRALLPGSLWHYVVLAFVLKFVEGDNQIGRARINAPPDDDLEYFENKMAGFAHWMFDWTNFNLYHSVWEMDMVIRHLSGTVYAPADHDHFVNCIADAMYNMVLIDPEGGKHNLGRGMYSGWRGTSFINNVLNDCYTQCAEMCFSRLYGREALFYADEGGDDLDAGLNRPEDGYRMLAIMKQMNFRAADIKQMVAHKAEFFRNTITPDGVYASPVRALTTFVNGKWEGSGNVPIKERISAILDQMAKIKRRGMDGHFCNTLAVISLSHWCKINTQGEWLDLPPTVVHGRLEDNGFGVPDDAGMVWCLRDRVPDPVTTATVGEPPGKLVTMDMIAVLAREVKALNIELEVSASKVAEVAAASFDAYNRYDYTNVFQFETVVTGRQPVVEARVNENAWLDFLDFMEMDGRATKIGRIMRYEEMLPFMTVSGKPVSREDLMAIFEISACPEVLDFKGNVHYRRLIAEPLARRVTEFCMELVASGVSSLAYAEEVFKDLCYLTSLATEFML